MDVVRARLANQHLVTPGLANASDVVRTLGAVQAQDYAGAKWAVAQRTAGATDADIERELNEGRILRTHVLRPTWHFVTQADIRWMLALTAPRVKSAMAYYDRVLELTPAVYRRSNAAIARALTGGKHLTRAALRTVLERAGVKITTGQRLGHVMMRAELDAIVCSGPRQGKQFTYALLDERAPPVAALDRDASLLELTRRYFATRGPATARDFAWWSGLTVADAKRGVQMGGAGLLRLSGEEDLWHATHTIPRTRPTAHLLPNYDEYVIGYKDRSAFGRRLEGVRSVARTSAVFAHIVCVDGELVGGWKRLAEGKSLVVDLNLVARLTPSERRRIAAEAGRFGKFAGTEVTIRGLSESNARS